MSDIFSSSVWPVFEQDEIDAVSRVLRSGKVNYWTGTETKLFEKEFARYVGCDHAIALANGTLALELALYAIGLQPGDEVIVPAKTFIATASAVVRVGGVPVVADIDLISQTILLDSIKSCVTKKTKAIIPVHLAGWPCDMAPIMQFAQDKGLFVIEDCAQAHGAKYKGMSVGSLGHVGVFSFCQDKIMTTGGEGGMLTTNDKDLWKRAWQFKDHGKNYEKAMTPNQSSLFCWLHDEFGSNFRMTEMQSAIGRIQLSKLDQWKSKRQKNALFLTNALKDISALKISSPPEWIDHAYYKFYVFLDLNKLKPDWNQIRILETLKKEGIYCFSGSCSEIYKEKAFEIFPDVYKKTLPNATKLGQVSLMFLVHPTIQESELKHVSETIHKVFDKVS